MANVPLVQVPQLELSHPKPSRATRPVPALISKPLIVWHRLLMVTVNPQVRLLLLTPAASALPDTTKSQVCAFKVQIRTVRTSWILTPPLALPTSAKPRAAKLTFTSIPIKTFV
jgi:hypothetical protein